MEDCSFVLNTCTGKSGRGFMSWLGRDPRHNKTIHSFSLTISSLFSAALFAIAHSKWSEAMSKPVEDFLVSPARGKDGFSNWKRVYYAASGVGKRGLVALERVNHKSKANDI